MIAERDNLKILSKDFILNGGHTVCCKSILYIDKYRKVGKEYFVFNTKNNFLKIPSRKSKKICVCVGREVNASHHGDLKKQKARLSKR